MFRFLPLLLLLFNGQLFAASHCVILQYHHVDDNTPAVTSVTPDLFDQHLQYLKQNNFKVLALQDVVLSLKNQLQLPDKCIAITFDDAYVSIYRNAWPRLRELNWPFTVFVNSAAVDHGYGLSMGWEQLRDMSKHGASLQNHGHGHIHMVRKLPSESERAWLSRVGSDIQTAQQRITREIGIAPTLFAFPYGEYNPQLIRLISAMGFSGFGQQSGPAWPDADFGALPRFPMAAQYAAMKSFATKVYTLPLPLTRVSPQDPMPEPGQSRPTLRISLAPGRYSRENLNCYVDGKNRVDIHWLEQQSDIVEITPLFDLVPGRHRTNCTMPSDQRGRFHWYSHNWFIRKKDGSWYAEY